MSNATVPVEPDDSECIHVYPQFGREHDTEHGLGCWCQPQREADEPRVIVHNVEQ